MSQRYWGAWPRDYTTGQAMPRVIRKVVKRDRKGKPKIAYDRKAGIRMERITARVDKPCERKGCRRQGPTPDTMGMILCGEMFAQVYLGTHKRIYNRTVPVTADYHINCVPEPARPLVRFLWPDK